MKGLELSKAYFETYGREMLEEGFADILPKVAVGFVGSGSEHYGFDDETSQDHDFEPGFCLFLPGEDVVDRRREFQLERAYAKLPKEFMGYRRQPMSPVGGNRNGVIRTAEFYQKAVGSADGTLSVDAWLHIPDYALAEATNGEIFYDEYGEFTSIRNYLLHMPEDIRLKRLAGNLLLMGQSGQYNFLRCIRHQEPEAAQLALYEFVQSALKTIFLIKGRYLPYYKWSFRALRQLDDMTELAEDLSLLLQGDNRDDETVRQKYEFVEKIAGSVIALLNDQDMTNAICGDLEKHAYSVNDRIADSHLRNLHILEAV